MKIVLDHCHITGKYLDTAHSILNPQLAINPDTVKIPVILHNLKGYDSHLICLLYTSPSPRDATLSRMPSSA